jgi:hypothetical protein
MILFSFSKDKSKIRVTGAEALHTHNRSPFSFLVLDHNRPRSMDDIWKSSSFPAIRLSKLQIYLSPRMCTGCSWDETGKSALKPHKKAIHDPPKEFFDIAG